MKTPHLLLLVLFAGCASAPAAGPVDLRAGRPPTQLAFALTSEPACAALATQHALLSARLERSGLERFFAFRGGSDERRLAACEARAERMGCSLNGGY